MIFVKWAMVVVASVVLVYWFMWLGGGWNEVLASTLPVRVKLVTCFIFLMSAVLALIVASEVQYRYEFFDEWLFADVIWLTAAFLFGATVDPLVSYGLLPWQWSTWWTALFSLTTLWTILHFYLSFKDEWEFRRYLASEGLWR